MKIHFKCKYCKKFVGDRRLARKHLRAEHVRTGELMNMLERIDLDEKTN